MRHRSAHVDTSVTGQAPLRRDDGYGGLSSRDGAQHV
jgi:hypothetical protein